MRTPRNAFNKTYARMRSLFLDELMKGFSVSHACRVAGINRTTMYKFRDEVPGFAMAWDEAIEAGTDKLEDEAYRRAHDGTEKPVFYQGEIVGGVQEYSDNLMKFLLEGRRPDKFRAKVAVDASQPVTIVINGGLPARPIETKE